MTNQKQNIGGQNITDREDKLRSILLDLYDFLEEGHYDNDPLMEPFYKKIKKGLSLFYKDWEDSNNEE